MVNSRGCAVIVASGVSVGSGLGMVGVGFAFCVGGSGVAVGVGETVDEHAVMTSIPPKNMNFSIFCTFPP